ncbi:DUF2950 family protein [Paracoccus sp. Z330]|uniref:DUF2950 family protein n=1 Tax=Paracoccus onchidii TaxID=3017813 RepID=A0ABT4ZKV2_9RHOB|nr:DUF2950 family protein [Paracoccus onchidii]MDB6179355.1 DUF2950 family protein [Paracoccus onchidii]
MMRMIALSAGLTLAPMAAIAAPQSYESPQAALEALVSAAGAEGEQDLLTVFGAEAAETIFSGDEIEDAGNRRMIENMVNQGYRFVPEAEFEQTIIEMGNDHWPFPIPLVRDENGWSFDVEAGRQEMLARRIGLNELNTMTLIDAYGDIQAQFRLVDQDGDGVMEFARSLIATAEDRDGLYWPGGDSPLGEHAARASLDGFSEDGEDLPSEPLEGYLFRVLDGQGENAPGGAMSYLVNDNMVAGHAILAVPAVYGDTGIHSFMMAENGIILQADLGEDSLNIAAEITSYDPDESWVPAYY